MNRFLYYLLILIAITIVGCERCSCDKTNSFYNGDSNASNGGLVENHISELYLPTAVEKSTLMELLGPPVDSFFVLNPKDFELVRTEKVESYLFYYKGDTIQYFVDTATSVLNFSATDVSNTFSYLSINNVPLNSSLKLDDLIFKGGCELRCNSRVLEIHGITDLKVRDSHWNIDLQFKDEKLVAFQISPKN